MPLELASGGHLRLASIGDLLLAGESPSPPPAAPVMDNAGFAARVVGTDGEVVQDLIGADGRSLITFQSCTFRIDDPAPTATFTINQHVPEALAIGVLDGHEIQIWEEGETDPFFWGPAKEASADGHDLTVGCIGPWWYLQRRFHGHPLGSENLLTNGDFEDGLTGWTLEDGGVPFVGAAIDPFNAITGAQSVQMSAPAVINNVAIYLHKTYGPYTSAYGQVLTLTAWVMPDATWDKTPPFFLKGLELTRWVNLGTELADSSWAQITDNVEPGQWTKLETKVRVPPDEESYFEARLYMVGDLVNWDDVRLNRYESSTLFAGTDVAAGVAQIVAYGQKVAAGKSDVNLGADSTPVGLTLTRKVQWSHWQHPWIAQGLMDMAVEFGFEIDVAITSTARTVTTHYPRMGTDRRTGLGAFTLDAASIATANDGALIYAYGETGDAVATNVLVEGWADGISGTGRQDGGYSDASGTGGIVLEDVVQAPPKSTPAALGYIAVDEWRHRSVVPKVLQVEVTRTGAANVQLGDLINVAIADGWVQIAGEYRVVEVTIQANHNRTVILNHWIDP